MDGWETRRRRTPGYDWCIVRLGLPGILRGVVVDTSFFTGNYPEQFFAGGLRSERRGALQERIEKTAGRDGNGRKSCRRRELKGDSQNPAAIANAGRFTHVRFKIYPDGGVARLRLHGEVMPDAARTLAGRDSIWSRWKMAGAW